MQWFEGDIKITLCPQFSFQLNYENDEKIWNLEIIFTKKVNNENFKIVIK